MGLFNWSKDDNGVMSIYLDNCLVVAEISDCGRMNDNECSNLMWETLEDLGYEIRV